jgi:hypothetical protein
MPVRHASWGEGIVARATADSVTVLFDAVGSRMFDLALVQERNPIERFDAVGALLGAIDRAHRAPSCILPLREARLEVLTGPEC